VDAHGSSDGADGAGTHSKRIRRSDGDLNELAVVCEAKIIVAGQVDDLATVVMAHRRLLVVEHAQPEVRTLSAEII
jgi:hypothetical protein